MVSHQLARSLPDCVELLGRNEAVLTERLDAGEMLAFKPGHAHHIEFVEIICRDRQETQPFEERMVQVIRFGEDPLVEGKPGELAIDEACLGMEVDRPDLDRLRAGAHYCSPVGAKTGLLHVDTTSPVKVCHVIAPNI